MKQLKGIWCSGCHLFSSEEECGSKYNNEKCPNCNDFADATKSVLYIGIENDIDYKPIQGADDYQGEPFLKGHQPTDDGKQEPDTTTAVTPATFSDNQLKQIEERMTKWFQSAEGSTAINNAIEQADKVNQEIDEASRIDSNEWP